MTTLARLQGGSGADLSQFGAVNKDFDARWKAALDACRAKPNKMFIDVFKPEGDLLRRMAGG